MTMSNDTNKDVHFKRGDGVEIYWPIYLKYYKGIIKRLYRSVYATVLYDDGGKKVHMGNQTWKFEENDLDENSLTDSSGANSSVNVIDAKPKELWRMFEFFGKNAFFRFYAQGFQQYVLTKTYKLE